MSTDIPTEPSDFYLTEDEVKQAAICLLAADACAGDSEQAEDAVKWAQRLYLAIEEQDTPWKGRVHMGDCTKNPTPCITCLIEDAERRVVHRFNYE